LKFLGGILEDNFSKTAFRAKSASKKLAVLSGEIKDKALLLVAENIEKNKEKIFDANKQDLESAKNLVESGEITSSTFNRLKLDENKMRDMVQGIKDIVSLDNSLKEEVEKIKKKNNKDLKCDLDWPICIYDFKDLEKNFDYIVLKQLPEPEVIDDYFSENKKYENSKNIINNEDKFEDLLIERKKHFCNSKIKSIRDNLIKNENIENIENKIIIEKIEENNIINLEENIEKKEINELIINTANENQKIINFEKEKAEDSIMSFD
jgi:hypothetical protein